MRGKDVALIAGVVVIGLLIAGLFSVGMMGYGRGGPYGGWMGPGMMGGLGFGWGILMMLFWVLVIGGVVMLAARLLERDPSPLGPGNPDRNRQKDRALDVVRERYARGEITKEQYDQMRRDLE